MLLKTKQDEERFLVSIVEPTLRVKRLMAQRL